jgi:hypothetical protein
VIAAAGAFALGVVLRVVIYRSSIGHLGTDEAVWGLMARHAEHGEVSAFFWGQAYGGTQEVLPVAFLFRIFGTHLVLMRLVPIVFSAAAIVVVWRIGRRLGGESVGLTAALLLWYWPVYAVWKVEIWSGFYGGGLLYSALVLWLVLLVDERQSRSRIALLGVVLGLAFWESLQTVAIIVPALAWLTVRRPRAWIGAWAAVPGAVLGALPWLLSNLSHDWWSFSLHGGGGTYPSRLRAFGIATFPEMLGLRVPFSVEWLPDKLVGGAVYIALAATIVVTAWLWRRRAAGLLPLVVIVFPLVAALSALTTVEDEPRYVFVLAPALVLLAATAASRLPRSVLLLAVAAVLSSVALAKWIDWRDDRLPIDRYNTGEVDVRPAITTLERAGIDRAFAHYSIAYRMTFDTRERVIVSEADLSRLTVVAPGRVLPPAPTGYTTHRHPAYDRAVRTAARFAYVFVQRQPGLAVDARLLHREGFTERRAGTLVVFVSP